MADTAILAAGGDDAPLSYLVPGLAVIRIKQIHVKYVDNGAGADWLPAVRVINDSGHRMGTAADQAVKVTAGSDADVSFFPGVKHAPTAAPAGGGIAAVAEMWFDNLNFGDPTVAVPQNVGFNVPFANFYCNDLTIMNQNTTTNPGDTLQLKSSVHFYMVAATVRWQTNGIQQAASLSGGAGTISGGQLRNDLLTGLSSGSESFLTATAAGQQLVNDRSVQWVWPSATPHNMLYQVIQTTAVSTNLLQGFVIAVAFPFAP